MFMCSWPNKLNETPSLNQCKTFILTLFQPFDSSILLFWCHSGRMTHLLLNASCKCYNIQYMNDDSNNCDNNNNNNNNESDINVTIHLT